jgi:intein-encoded DNA endonuclease-like protein
VRRYLPRGLRIKLYDDVVALRRCGLTYGGIVEEARRRYGVRLSKSHISYWIRGVHSPYNGRRIPSMELLEPSEALAYIIGAILGDGYPKINRRVSKGYRHTIIRFESRQMCSHNVQQATAETENQKRYEEILHRG